MRTTKKLGPAWMLSTVHTETNTAQKSQEVKVGDAKDRSAILPLSASTARNPRLGPSGAGHTPVNIIQKHWFRSSEQCGLLKGWAFSHKSGKNLFIAELSDSTPGKAMHKVLASGHAAQIQKKSHHRNKKSIVTGKFKR